MDRLQRLQKLLAACPCDFSDEPLTKEQKERVDRMCGNTPAEKRRQLALARRLLAEGPRPRRSRKSPLRPGKQKA